MRRADDNQQLILAHRKRTRLAAVLIFGLIPLTLVAAQLIFNGRQYMLASLLLLIYTFVPFFMVFERRRPKAREMVLIAMVSALTVCLQLVCRFTIPVSAGTAMVIVAGVALGPEAGFLIGALARFMLNFYEGQGPWTPWQMFCWGLLAFLAGLAFNRAGIEKRHSRQFKLLLGPVVCVVAAELLGYLYFLLFRGPEESFFGWRLYIFGALGLLAGVLLQRRRLLVDDITLTVFTFFGIFIIYGGLMNICAMVTAAGVPGSDVSWDQLKVLYLSGVPYDLGHALGSAVFMFVFGNNLIYKLERIKIKYGIYR